MEIDEKSIEYVRGMISAWKLLRTIIELSDEARIKLFGTSDVIKVITRFDILSVVDRMEFKEGNKIDKCREKGTSCNES